MSNYCPNCGTEIQYGSAFCPNCGTQFTNSYTQQTAPTMVTDDNPSFGWTLLGFFVPVVGLILYLVWKDQKPLTAKKAGKGALIAVIVEAVFMVIYFIAMIIIAAIGYGVVY